MVSVGCQCLRTTPGAGASVQAHLVEVGLIHPFPPLFNASAYNAPMRAERVKKGHRVGGARILEAARKDAATGGYMAVNTCYVPSAWPAGEGTGFGIVITWVSSENLGMLPSVSELQSPYL